ncbi:MAG: hypothetical protein ACJ8LG_21605 [Massilia sp.]
MLAADCLPGVAVTVRAVDDFYKFIDGWRGIIAQRQDAPQVRIECKNPDGQAVEFLVPPEQLERTRTIL